MRFCANNCLIIKVRAAGAVTQHNALFKKSSRENHMTLHLFYLLNRYLHKQLDIPKLLAFLLAEY